VLVIALAPISFGPVQLRVADVLIPLSALFGWPVVAGVTIGCFVGNVYIYLGPTDIILGPVANMIAATIILMLRRQRLLACITGALPIGLIVGGYLWLVFGFQPPSEFGFLPPLAAMIVSISVSSFIAIGVLGYILLVTLSQTGILEPLKAHGLKILK